MTDMGTALREAQDYARGPATRILRNYPDDVDDVLQEAARKALRGIGDFRGESQFRSWFTRIVITEALMRLRSARSHEERCVPLDLAVRSAKTDARALYSADGDNKIIHCLPAETPTPEQIAIADELRRAIDSEAATWGPVLKDELRLMLLGVGPGVDNTRKARRFRVRRILRKALKGKGLL